jgi:hypothetical protein
MCIRCKFSYTWDSPLSIRALSPPQRCALIIPGHLAIVTLKDAGSDILLMPCRNIVPRTGDHQAVASCFASLVRVFSCT